MQGRDRKIFSSPPRPDLLWCKPTLLISELLRLGVKKPGRETNHSFPSRSEVKNVCIYTCISPYEFMAWCSVKHRDNFTFTFTMMKFPMLWAQTRMKQMPFTLVQLLSLTVHSPLRRISAGGWALLPSSRRSL